jgi:retron-type reverse transcriptase
MINELLGIQFNIAKADRTDHKVQNLASYINKETLITIHKQMDGKKAKGIDGTSKEEYEVNLEANIENLVIRMRNGSYKPNPIRRVYIPKDGSNKMRPLASDQTETATKQLGKSLKMYSIGRQTI